MSRHFLLALVLILGPRPSFAQCDVRDLPIWKNATPAQLQGCQGVNPLTLNPTTTPASGNSNLPVAGSPQHGSALSTPILGLVPSDTPGEIQIIRGTPSSAILLPPAYAPVRLNRVFIPSRQAFVLAETTSPVEVGVLTVDGESLGAPALIPAAMTGADLVSFSPDGASALLYRVSSNRLQLITGLPSAPTITRDVEVSGLLSPAFKVAVSDDSSQVLCLTSDGTLYNVSAQGAATLLYSGKGSGSVAFLPQSSSALLWDGGSQALIQIAGISTGPSAIVLAANLNFGPDALLEVTADSKRALLADSSSSSVLSIDLSSRALNEIQVGRSAPALKSLRIPNLFLLSSETGKPAWVLYLDSSGGRSYGVARTAARRVIVPLSAANQVAAAPVSSVASPVNTVVPPVRAVRSVPKPKIVISPVDMKRASTEREQ
jgi:hypothetical protein